MMNIAVRLAVDKPGCRLVEDNDHEYLQIYYVWYPDDQCMYVAKEFINHDHQ